MIILTGANSDSAKNDAGVPYKNFSFRKLIEQTVKNAEKFGYKAVVYDLGALGIGKPFHIESESFKKNGYYEAEVKKGYKSKSLFKPAMVKECMEEHDDFTVYLDGDALLCDRIDEIISDDFDIGVALRDPKEIESDWHKDHFDIVKYVNAGVIFFNSTPGAKKFIDTWKIKTDEVGNDQMALNYLTCPDHLPEVNSILSINGIRIKYFPGMTYNYYYFNESYDSNIKIMHFKGDVRHFYPLNWKKHLYCTFVVPIKNSVRSLVKSVWS